MITMYARTINLCIGGQSMLHMQELILDFKKSKNYLFVSTVIFMIGVWLGTQHVDMLKIFIEDQINSLRNTMQWISDSQNPQLWLLIVIFFNNFTKAIIFMFLGLAFGILPVIMLFVNGLLLGYVLFAEHEMTIIELFVKGILPHGIIEIPAIILACAYGIKLGTLLAKSIVFKLISVQFEEVWSEFKHTLRLTKKIIVFLFFCFAIAALIESTISLWLMSS